MKSHELTLDCWRSIHFTRQSKERTSTNVRQSIRTVQFTMVSTMLQETPVIECGDQGVPPPMLDEKENSLDLFQYVIIADDQVVIDMEQLTQILCFQFVFQSPGVATREVKQLVIFDLFLVVRVGYAFQALPRPDSNPFYHGFVGLKVLVCELLHQLSQHSIRLTEQYRFK